MAPVFGGLGWPSWTLSACMLDRSVLAGRPALPPTAPKANTIARGLQPMFTIGLALIFLA